MKNDGKRKERENYKRGEGGGTWKRNNQREIRERKREKEK